MILSLILRLLTRTLIQVSCMRRILTLDATCSPAYFWYSRFFFCCSRPKTFHFLRKLVFWNLVQHGGEVRMISIFQLDRFLEKFLLPILLPLSRIQSLFSFLVELQHNIFRCKVPLIAMPTNTHSFLSSLRFTIMQF